MSAPTTPAGDMLPLATASRGTNTAASLPSPSAGAIKGRQPSNITDLTQARLSRRYAEMVADGVPSIPTAHLSLVDETPRSVVERQIEFAEQLQDYGDMPAGVALAERTVEFFSERSGRIGIALYIFGTVVGCYFAFQAGRGVL